MWVSHVKHKPPFVLEVTTASSRRNFPQDYLVLIHTLEYFEKKKSILKNMNFYDLRLLSKNFYLFSLKLIPRFILGVLDT